VADRDKSGFVLFSFAHHIARTKCSLTIPDLLVCSCVKQFSGQLRLSVAILAAAYAVRSSLKRLGKRPSINQRPHGYLLAPWPHQSRLHPIRLREDIQRQFGRSFASLAHWSRSPLSACGSQRLARPNRRARDCRAVRAMLAPMARSAGCHQKPPRCAGKSRQQKPPRCAGQAAAVARGD
jgi:hypothetical protein